MGAKLSVYTMLTYSSAMSLITLKQSQFAWILPYKNMVVGREECSGERGRGLLGFSSFEKNKQKGIGVF